MRRMVVLVAVAGTACGAAPAQAAPPDTVTWLSRVGLAGAGSNGATGFHGPPSADGSKVVFLTSATNFGGGAVGTTSLGKVYLRDVRTGAMTLVSNPEHQPGTVANGNAGSPGISGDGRWVAFASSATNLIPGFVDDNGDNPDVYLYEVATGDLTLASHSAASPTMGGNGQSDSPSFSHDGRHLLFASSSSSLISPYTDGNGGNFDAFVYDRVSGVTRLVTRTPGSATTGLNGDTYDAFITSDGRYAVFSTTASDAVAFTDNNGVGGYDVFLTAIGTGVHQLISHEPGDPASGSNSNTRNDLLSPSASRLAGTIAYRTAATNLVDGFTDLNAGASDVYVWDRSSDTTRLVSHEFGSATRGGTAPAVDNVGVSDDGSVVVYGDRSANLVPGSTDLGLASAVFAYDTRTSDNTLLSHAAADPLEAGNNNSTRPFPTADGRFVTFTSAATDLVTGFSENNGSGAGDVFMIDRTGSPAPVSQTPPAITGAVTPGSTLTCSPGTWTEDPVFAFSWQRGTAQVGIGSTYALTSGDVSQPLRCVVIASTFGGATSAASAAVTLPPTIAGPTGATGPSGDTGATGAAGPAGPAGPAAPVAFALAATRFTAKVRRPLRIAFVSTAAGRLTWTATARRQKTVRKSVNVRAGRGTISIVLPRKAAWRLSVALVAGGRTARDAATVRVR